MENLMNYNGIMPDIKGISLVQQENKDDPHDGGMRGKE
jgi:hypothetical protein